MALSHIRLEAEGTTLAEVVADIEAAVKAHKVPKDMVLRNEHYDRGRRVYGRPSKGPFTVLPNVVLTAGGNSAPGVTTTYTNAKTA